MVSLLVCVHTLQKSCLQWALRICIALWFRLPLRDEHLVYTMSILTFIMGGRCDVYRCGRVSVYALLLWLCWFMLYVLVLFMSRSNVYVCIDAMWLVVLFCSMGLCISTDMVSRHRTTQMKTHIAATSSLHIYAILHWMMPLMVLQIMVNYRKL